MARQIVTNFDEEDFAATTKKFYNYLSVDNTWFGEMLYDIKQRWNDNGLNITDILVRQGQQIYLGSIKTHIPYSPPTKKQHPRNEDIKAIVNLFTSSEENDLELIGKVLNFSISIAGLGSFRINFSNDSEGACLAIRIHPHTIPQIGNVGYPEFFRKYISSFVIQTNLEIPSPKRINEKEDEAISMIKYKTGEIQDGGLILHIGPTGSGKTTAIASEFGFLAENTTGRMLTYENPVEYRFHDTKAPVSQFELGDNIKAEKGKNHFEEIPGHLLRNYPAAVLIGEARDHSEMKMVLDIASRGHLVFSTIHAINFAEAVSNLSVAVGQDKNLLSSLKAVVAHKLIRNTAGKIFPLLEIVIINKTLRKHLVEGDHDQLFRLVYQTERDTENEIQTFKDALGKLQSNEKISPADRLRILESNIGLFWGYDGEKE